MANKTFQIKQYNNTYKYISYNVWRTGGQSALDSCLPGRLQTEGSTWSCWEACRVAGLGELTAVLSKTSFPFQQGLHARTSSFWCIIKLPQLLPIRACSSCTRLVCVLQIVSGFSEFQPYFHDKKLTFVIEEKRARP